MELMIDFAVVATEFEERQHKALERIGELVAKKAQALLGTYQPAVGPLPAWDPLAETTLNGVFANGAWHPGKIELGFATPDDDNPLRRTGEMGQSIEYRVEGHRSVEIGSDSDKLLWAELGTVNEPARSVLERAALVSMPRVGKIAQRAVLEALGGPRLIAPEED